MTERTGTLKKKKSAGDKPPQADMLSFAAVMTILLAFFIMLSTFAGKPEEERSKEAIESFKAALKNFGLSEIILGRSDSINNLIFVLKKTGGSSTRDEKQVLNKSFANLIDKEMEITYKKEGSHLVFPTEIDFFGGGLVLTPSSKIYLNNLIKLVKERNLNISVRGYTGKGFVPTDEFPTSWHSSAEHAAAVTKYLHNVGKIDYKRMTAIGHGKYQPLPGDTSSLDKQTLNRISIMVSNKDGT